MFKRVEDDVLLGVSKVITKNNQATSSLLIDEEKNIEKSKLDIDNKDIDNLNEEEMKENLTTIAKESLSLEELITITNDNEELIRSIIEKKDGLKSAKEKFTSKEDDSVYEENINKDSLEENISLSRESIDRNDYNEMKEELLSSLKEHIGYLKEQIDTKDQQLQNKDELIRNFQVLMKSDKDRIHELEAGNLEKELDDTELQVGDNSDANNEDLYEENKTVDTQQVNVKSKKRTLLNWFKK